MFGACWENIRKCAPLIHSITNYVTVNDVANVLIACGARPIMADDVDEVEEVTSACMGLNINIGTLNRFTVPSMILAGKKSTALGHPVVLDPVGAGASTFRTNTAKKLLSEVKIDVVRGNISELKAIVSGAGKTKGVDVNVIDAVTESNISCGINFAKTAAAKLKAVVAITGETDFVADRSTCYVIRNGQPEMSKVTGTGCQLSGLIAACVAVNRDNMLEATAAAVAAMGLAGELGWDRMEAGDGNATYRNKIIDAIYCMDGAVLERGSRYELK